MENKYTKIENWTDNFYKTKKMLNKKPILRTLFLELTLRCNARCEHCGSSCGDEIRKDEITADEIKIVLKSLADNPKYNPRNIMLAVTGGEPLLKKEIWDIMKYAHELGFPWGMTSNGFLINKDVVDKMVETGMYSISISLDGLEKTHESFRKVKPGEYKKLINGVKLMLKTPEIKVVQITTCVNKKNIDELEEMFTLLGNLGIKEWRIVEVDPIGRAKVNDEILMSPEDYQRMFDFIEEKQNNKYDMHIMYGGCGHFIGKYEGKFRKHHAFCGAGTLIGCILSNGDIFVCPDVVHRPELIQGNIRKDDFIDVWENRYKPYRSIRRIGNSKCFKCEYWKLCTGDGFHTWNFEENKPNFCYKELIEVNEKTEKKKETKTKKKKSKN